MRSNSYRVLGRGCLSPPAKPGEGDGQLDGAGDPEGRAHASGAALQPAAGDAAGDSQHSGGDATVALSVSGPPGQQRRVAEQVAVQAGEDVCGHLGAGKHAAGDDLPAELEGEQRQRQHCQGRVLERTPRSLLFGRRGRGQARLRERWDGPRLGERRGGEQEDRLREERREDGRAPPCRAGDHEAQAREDEAAGPKGGDGDESAQPQERGARGQRRRAEREEDGVACIVIIRVSAS